MEMEDIHKALQNDQGRDPFEAQNAAARAYHAANPPETAAPAAPTKPTVWSKISGIFAKQKEEARAKYLRLLKKCEVDGRELSEKEIQELAAAMKEAVIDEDQAAEHREMLRRHAAATAAAKKLPAATTAMQEAARAIEDHDKKVQAMAVERNALAAANEDAATNYRFAQLAAAPLPGLDEARATLFGGE